MRLGLTENALRTIATSRPQRDVYYVCKELGQRTFSLPLGPLGLECLASNTAEDHVLMDALLAKEGTEGFAARWLDVHGFHEEARYVEAQQTTMEGMNIWEARDAYEAQTFLELVGLCSRSGGDHLRYRGDWGLAWLLAVAKETGMDPRPIGDACTLVTASVAGARDGRGTCPALRGVQSNSDGHGTYASWCCWHAC